MKFEEALALCRRGRRICRASWNGVDQFVYWQAGGIAPVSKLRCGAIWEWAEWRGRADVEIMGRFDIKTAGDVIRCGWLATQEDMQADDWEVYELEIKPPVRKGKGK
jgi:hypothetical protein